MKRPTMLANILLLSSYSVAMEHSLEIKLSRKNAFCKIPFVTLQNKLAHHDIATINDVLQPGDSKKIKLQPSNDSLKLTVFIEFLKTGELTLEFGEALPNNICFTQKQNCIDVTYNGELRGSYECK
ncbi:MAG TPA: hypothetical protein VHX42_00590 [Candidatus Babeliales bacterium]|jgi:hypothetical protein|nr:hypothetical protein [Candidatus Babeliales bacterium]